MFAAHRLAAAVLVVLLQCACAPRSGSPFALDSAVVRPGKSAVIFFVDGLDRAVFEEMLAAGELPAIHERFVVGGVGVERAVASLPPVTYANSVSILTGTFPGHHGILGNEWFDPVRLLYRDYGRASTYQKVNGDFPVPTIYELLSDHFTVNVQCHTRRGVTATTDNKLASLVDWGLGRFSNVDKRVGERIDRVFALSRKARRWPTILLNYFPGVDACGHMYGPESTQYRNALHVVDAAIGEIADAIEAAGLRPDTYFVLVTDHGMTEREDERTADVAAWLRSRHGWHVFRGRGISGDFAVRHSRLERCDAVIVNSRRCLQIHLRGEADWPNSRSSTNIERVSGAPGGEASRYRDGLLERPGVGLVCSRAGPGRVRVESARGAAIVEKTRAGEGVVYRLTHDRRGSDPDDPPHGAGGFLGYRTTPELAEFVDSGWHSSREWLAATIATDYPDLVPQVVEMFASPRAGDLVIFAAEGWSFKSRMRGGHGSCHAEDMIIPMYFAGPGLARGGTISHARSVDVMPTILDLLGELERLSAHGSIDGVSIAPELNRARTNKLDNFLRNGRN